MRHEGERITTLGALMDALLVVFGSRKTFAVIHCEEGDVYKVQEYFDDGRGHSGAFYSHTAEVDPKVFNEARAKGYVTGKLEPGYVSTIAFVLTNERRLKNEASAIASSWLEKDFWEKRSAYDVSQGKSGTYIKITSLPEGEAPEDVRRAWVGVVVPALPIVGYSEDREKGVLSHTENRYNRYGYAVPQEEALKALELVNQQAALWWRERGFPIQDEGKNYFSFSNREAEEIAGNFVRQKIRVYDPILGEYDH